MTEADELGAWLGVHGEQGPPDQGAPQEGTLFSVLEILVRGAPTGKDQDAA